jgi:hypothetical protein
MPTNLIIAWAATGALAGVAVQTWTRRLLTEVPPERWTGDQAAFAVPVRDCS